MKLIERELDIIKKEMQSGFTEPFAGESVSDFIFDNTKMIRANLCVLYLKTLGVVLDDKMYKILAAGELIHNASLLHDDVIDCSEKRRGKLSVWKKYNSKIAVLLGDYLLNFAVNKLLSSNNRIIMVFQNCINRMCLAEFKQYSLRNKKVSIEEYIEICKNKTGALFSSIIEACLIMVNKDIVDPKNFAEKFGVYFQLRNDLEEYSYSQDKKNKINTASDILGIEKANILIDNYRQDLLEDIKKLPDNEFRKELERLVTELCMTKRN